MSGAPRRRAAAFGAIAAVLGAIALAAPAARAAVGFAPAPASPYRVPVADSMLEAADLNLDGRDDLAFASAASVGALLGSPAGDLSPVSGSPFQTGAGTRWVQPGDLNGDGLPDLVSAGEEAGVMLATGAGTFAPAAGSPFEVGPGAAPTSVAIADFNRDGHADLAFADCGLSCGGTGIARVSLFLGDGHGTFSEAPGSPSATGLAETSTLATADFNGDGEADVVVGGRGNVAVLLGDGHGELGLATGSPAGTGSARTVADLAAGDVNGDGLADVVTANSADATVTVLLGDGHGRLSASDPPFPTGSSGSAQGVALSDVDADGDLDMVVANERSAPLTGDISVLLGDGRGSFSPIAGSPISTGGDAAFARVGDFNGDGQPDVASAGGHGKNVSVLLNANRAAATPSASLLAYRAFFLGETSQAETLTVTNTGTGFLRLGQARIAGSQRLDFLLGADGCSGTVVLAGRSCSLTVSFRPTAGGIRESALELPSNVPGRSIAVVLSGTGIGVPSLTAVRLDHSRFAVRRSGRQYAASGKPHGARLQLTLSEQATVRVAFTRLVRGHRRAHVCRAKGRGPRCTLAKRLGHLNFHLPEGSQAVNVTGMLYGHPLPAGSYVLSAIAVNAQGQSSAAVSLRFQVLR